MSSLRTRLAAERKGVLDDMYMVGDLDEEESWGRRRGRFWTRAPVFCCQPCVFSLSPCIYIYIYLHTHPLARGQVSGHAPRLAHQSTRPPWLQRAHAASWSGNRGALIPLYPLGKNDCVCFCKGQSFADGAGVDERRRFRTLDDWNTDDFTRGQK